MIKQIFMTSALLVATMSQMVSSHSDLETDVPDRTLTKIEKINFSLFDRYKNADLNSAVNAVENNAIETFEFTFYNFREFPIYVTFSGPNGYYNVTVPADPYPNNGNPSFFTFEMNEGVYTIYCRTDYNASSTPVTYGMSCRGPENIVTVETATNDYTIENQDLGVDTYNYCTSLDIW